MTNLTLNKSVLEHVHDLLEIMGRNEADPNDMAADGVTVFDVWQQHARLLRPLLKAQINRRTAEAERDRLRNALTPSDDTKRAYMGEFSVPLPDHNEDGDEVMRNVNVPWTTIKKIMAAIRSHAALTKSEENR